MKIFNEENKSVFSNNVESNIDLELSTKIRLLPNENISKNLSLYEQYNRERDNCDKYRIILGINPICSNVLYNAKTEIVINEGSDKVAVVCDCDNGAVSKNVYAPSATNTTSIIKYIDAIRNTEYSHPDLGGFKYHCGFDIFNNHILRNDGYVHVNKLSNNGNGDNYNTISDYMRDSNGEIIKQNVNVRAGDEEKEMHLYQYDTILSMKTAFYERCEERDGWWGFFNSSNINIPNRGEEQGDIKTNTLLADRKPCEFIDLYPDRSLYSFIPKYNKYRKRIEANWDYCITYPFENDYELINTICGSVNGSIKASFIKKINSGGLEVLECSSFFKHNLVANNQIYVYYKTINDAQTIQKYKRAITVLSVGDNNGEHKDRIFTIRYSDVISIYEDLVKNNKFALYFKKISNGEECQYYFRKFKKLKNIDGSDLRSDINKIAFGKNIYGDDVAQVIFTDDIDISNLYDNNNRPLSEVYFTVIKRNAGHEIWYESGGTDSPKSASTIEYSHCFGKVTSGLDFSGMKEEPFDYNIHRMHNLDFNGNFQNEFRENNMTNIDFDFNDGNISYEYYQNGKSISGKIENEDVDVCRTFIMLGDSVLTKPYTLEDNITIDKDWFYGDVVEFDNSVYKETTISNIYHRVNTAQRETFDKCFRDILQDKIDRDDYDLDKDVNGTISTFNVGTYYINDVERGNSKWTPTSTVESVSNIKNKDKQLIYGNIMPEGNYYNPHTKIQLKSNDENVSSSDAILINYGNEGLEVSDTFIKIKYPINYGLYKNNYVAFFNKKLNSTTWVKIIDIDYDSRILTLEKPNNIEITLKDLRGDSKIYYVYWTRDSVPLYAKVSPQNRKFIWKGLTPPSQLRNNNSLYDLTFSNGRFYIEKNINFFLRRQDPFGKYGLSSPIYKKLKKEYTNPMDDFIISGSKQADFTGILYSLNNFENCF